MRFGGVFWSMVCSRGGGGFVLSRFVFEVLFEFLNHLSQRFPQTSFGSGVSFRRALVGGNREDRDGVTGLETNRLRATG